MFMKIECGGHYLILRIKAEGLRLVSQMSTTCTTLENVQDVTLWLSFPSAIAELWSYRTPSLHFLHKPTVARVCFLTASKRVVMLCFFELNVVFTLSELLQFFYRTHRIIY